jgi:hypothetical protein
LNDAENEKDYLNERHSPKLMVSLGLPLVIFKLNLVISYIKMKVCVCVCPAACRQIHTSHHPVIWRGLLISPWLGTKPGGNQKFIVMQGLSDLKI